MIDNFPTIKAACLTIAYDSGMINREETQDMFLASCEEVFGAEGVDNLDLVQLELWLEGLGPEDLTTFLIGDDSEATTIAQSCPKNREGVPICNIFNDVSDL